MGLLDGLLDDPQSMARLQLAAGLLSPGNFGTQLGRGLQGYQGAQEAATMQELRKQQIESAKISYQQQAQKMALLAPVLSRLQGGDPQAQQAPQGPAPMSTSSMFSPEMNAARQGQTQTPMAGQPAPQGRTGFPLSFNDVVAFKLAGMPDLTNDFKMALEGVSHAPGSEVTDVSGNRRFVPVLDKGQTMGPDGSVRNIPGFVGSSAELTGATEEAKARATNRNTLVPLDRLERSPGLSPVTTLEDLINPPQRVAGAPGSNFISSANIAADMRRTGNGAAPVNAPMGAMTATGQPAFKTSADLAADKITAEGGAKLATEPKTKFATDAAGSASAYGTALDEKVRTGQDLMLRIGESRKALDDFKPGMGSDTRLQVARAAQAIGAPDSLVQRINQGDVAAKQEFVKLSAQTAMESLKQSMGSAGRITQAEFKVFQANNPNIELDPNAIKKIYDFATRVYQRDFSEQQGRADFLKQGGDPSQWAAQWSKTIDPTGKGTVGATPLPQNAKASDLKVGASYVLPNGKTGVWNGFKFKVAD